MLESCVFFGLCLLCVNYRKTPALRGMVQSEGEGEVLILIAIVINLHITITLAFHIRCDLTSA